MKISRFGGEPILAYHTSSNVTKSHESLHDELIYCHFYKGIQRSRFVVVLST